MTAFYDATQCIHALSACPQIGDQIFLVLVPIDSGTTSGAAPDLILAAWSNWLCVVAG